MTKLYLMRHGQTLFNTQGRVQGACDSPLTELGIEQAGLAKTYFDKEGISFDAVYSSTQERATDTAKIVSGQDQVVQLKGIKEMNFGTFEAQPEFLLPKHRPGAVSFEDLLVPYGGEDIIEVGKRVQVTILETLAKNEAESILMVSHGAAMWGLVQVLEIDFPKGVGFSNCAICVFDYQDGNLRLEKLVEPAKDFRTYNF